MFLQDVRGERAGERRGSNLRLAVQEAERDAVLQALKMARGNKAKAAKLLGIHRTGLYQKLAPLNLSGKAVGGRDQVM